MKDIKAITLSGADVVFEQSAVEAFKSDLRGELLTPADIGYDAARTVWNAMMDKRPALIARCAGVADVITCINFTRTHNVLFSVRGGGHNVAGKAACDGGLMIDLSPMRGIRIDPTNRTASAEAGLTWHDLDHETLAFGLATTGGVVSHTGIAGLTLGGGLGWLMAKHGFTCDNLLSADIVTAEGKFLTVSKTHYEDLFWAIRGGGGNFGVVTSFEYQLHPIGSKILGGMVLYPMDRAREVLQFYRAYSANAPDDLTIFAGLLTTPDGLPVVAIITGWFGSFAEGTQHLKPLREFGSPLADLIGEIPYKQLQTLFDAAVPFGIRRYWKSGYCVELPDDLLEIMISNMAINPSPLSSVMFFHIHGAAARIGLPETAFTARQKQWDIDIISQWGDAADDEKHIGWARTFWQGIKPFSKGVYMNHLDADDSASRVRLAYGQNYKRLVSLKSKYDPGNLFRMNSNIAPKSNAPKP